MGTVEVYKVRVYDVTAGGFRVSRRMATEEGAKRMCGEIIEETRVEIDASCLESGEQWTPIDFTPKSGTGSQGGE